MAQGNWGGGAGNFAELSGNPLDNPALSALLLERVTATELTDSSKATAQIAINAAIEYADEQIAAANTVELDGATLTTPQAYVNHLNNKFSAQAPDPPVVSALPASGDTTPAAEQVDISIAYATHTGPAITGRNFRVNIANDGPLSFNVAEQTLTFTGAPSGTSATLSAAWARSTKAYKVYFSNGDIRDVTLTADANTATWSGALNVGATSTAKHAYYSVPSGAQGAPLRLVESASWANGPAVTSSSDVYTIGTLGAAPTIITAPTITPLNADANSVLSLGGDVWANDDGNLSFAIRWVIDWTATGTLAEGATSATLTSNWLGSNGARTFTFSNGDSRSGNLTQNSTAVTWTGGLSGSATATIGVSVNDTDRDMQPIPQMVGHVTHGYITPTNSFGTGAEVQASNTVTPVATASGVAWTGLTQTQKDAIDAEAAVVGDTLAAGTWALIDAIPTSGGVTVATSGDLRSAMAANSTVFAAGGSHTLSAGGRLDVLNKKLLGVAGQIVNINLAAATVNTANESLRTQNATIANIRFDNAVSKCINDLGGSLFYQVLTDHTGNQTALNAKGVGFTCTGNGTRLVSCEARNGFSHYQNDMNRGASGAGNAGGDADGYNIKATVFAADCHAYRNSDDGWDLWDNPGHLWAYFCTAQYSGFNLLFPGAQQQGDGGGFKYGRGNSAHYNAWSNVIGCRAFAHNYNSQLVKPRIKAPSFSGNGSGNYAFGTGEPAAHYNVVA